MVGMVKYVSQFVLQMLPSIAATVVGAYIVTTYINPRTPPDAAKTAAAQAAKQAEKAEKAAPPAAAAVADDQDAASEAAEAKPVETKPAEVKASEIKSAPAADKAKPVKAAAVPADVRIIPIVKPATAATPSTGEAQGVVGERKEERKDANDLARAVIQRLRNPSETKEASRQVEEPARPAASSARIPQQVHLVPEAPAAPAVIPASAPPLPPAIDISAPRYPETATTASVGSDDRLLPPAEVPASVRKPLDLRATNVNGHNPSMTDDLLSATKSFFRAITP
jgi:hypothetical protein